MPKLPKHIIDTLVNNKTSLGKHPSFPPDRDDEMFIVYVLQKTFDELCDNIIADIDYHTMKTELSKLMSECQKIEHKNKDTLEQISAKIINEIFQIPNDVLNMDIMLVDYIDVSNQRLLPDKDVDFCFDDINDINNLSSEIYKRRMLNALVTGAAMYYMCYIGNFVKEFYEVNSDLPSLYKKIIDYNNILMFCEKDSISEKTTSVGKVDVTITSDDTRPNIHSEGVIVPVLIEETIKGLLELAISVGLPEDMRKTKYIMSKSDFRLAEIWDMRLGFSLWRLIEKQIKDCGYNLVETGINFFLMELSKLKTETFNETLQEIFAGTKKGKEMLSDIIDEINYKKDKDEFDDYIQTKNNSTIQINDDDCFEADELLVDDINEECFTAEELLTDDLNEE